MAAPLRRVTALFGRLCVLSAMAGVTTFSCRGRGEPVPEKGRVTSPVSARGVTVRSATSKIPASSESDRVRGPCGEQSRSVLFIGNSYTFYHTMPKMVTRIAESAGCPLEVTWATNGGYQLNLHAEDPTTLETIRSRPWDWVVLQNQSQKPGFLPEDVRRHSLPDVQKLATEIRQSHPETQILLYSTWGRRDGDRTNCKYNPEVCTFEGHTEALERGYSIYAESIGGDLAPVGRAFRAVKSDESAPIAFEDLYDTDGSHPSLFGSYLAAAVLFYELTGVSPEGLGYPSTLMAEEAAYLQQIAALTVNGVPLAPPGGSVVTKEKLVAKCDRCSPHLDTAAAQVVLFEGTCSDWYLRSDISEVASVAAEMSCTESGCRTRRIDTWGRDGAEEIPDGNYSVFVRVDADGSGGPSRADIEACEDSAFSVGKGQNLTIQRFYRSGSLT